MFCHWAATPERASDYIVSFRNQSEERKLKVQSIFKGQSCTTVDQILTLITQILLDTDFQAEQKQLSKYSCGAVQPILAGSPIPSERRKYDAGALHTTKGLLGLHKNIHRLHLPQLRDLVHKNAIVWGFFKQDCISHRNTFTCQIPHIKYRNHYFIPEVGHK